MVKVDSPDCDPEGDETVLSCDKAIGYTTSGTIYQVNDSEELNLFPGCYSPALGSGLAMANLPVNLTYPGTRLEVMLAGVPRPATVLPAPPLLTQPARERLERDRNI